MEAQVRISVSGPDKAAVKKSIGDFLVASGFARRTNNGFSRLGEIDPQEAKRIVDFVYDAEVKHTSTRIVTLTLFSTLIYVNLRRHRYRSI